MKNFIDDMSEEEILELTADDVERLIRFKMASEGVKIPLRPDVQVPEPPVLDRSKMVTVYKVGDLAFKSETEAMDFMQFVAKLNFYEVDYQYEVGLENSYLKAMSSHDRESLTRIQTMQVWPQEEWDTVSTKLLKYKKDKKTIEKLWDEYKSEMSAGKEIREDIMDQYNNAHVRRRDLQRSVSLFMEYMQIAEGNVPLATNFFLKAHPSASSQMEKIITMSGLSAVAKPAEEIFQ